MLSHHPHGEDLHIVTGDKDFASPLDKSRLNRLLELEWRHVKRSTVTIYPNLTSFFRDHYPNIKLASEIELEFAAGRLMLSQSFAQTHEIVARLPDVGSFRAAQLSTLADGVIYNPQVYRISDDWDVRDLIEDLLDRSEALDERQVDLLEELLGE